MRNSAMAIIFYFLAVHAGAQCVAQAPVAGAEQAGAAGWVNTFGTVSDTHEKSPTQQLPMDDGLPAVHAAAPQPPRDEKQAPGAGTAMVLAAVAVMSGIALRRYGMHIR